RLSCPGACTQLRADAECSRHRRLPAPLSPESPRQRPQRIHSRIEWPANASQTVPASSLFQFVLGFTASEFATSQQIGEQQNPYGTSTYRASSPLRHIHQEGPRRGLDAPLDDYHTEYKCAARFVVASLTLAFWVNYQAPSYWPVPGTAVVAPPGPDSP